MSDKSSQPGPDEDATQPFSRPDRDASPDETAPYEPVDEPDATRPLPKPGAGEDPDATQVVDAWTGRAEVRGPVPPADTEEWTDEEPEEEPGRRWWLPILLGVLGILVVIAVITAAVMLSNDGNEQPVPVPSTTPTAPATQAASPSPQPSSAAPSSAPPSAASTVLVPETFGDSQSVATGKLTALGLNVHVMTQEDPVAQPGTVLATTPPAGSVVPAGSDITIIVAKAPPSASPAPPSPSHQQPVESLSPAARPTGD